jgi:hypothetical protein
MGQLEDTFMQNDRNNDPRVIVMEHDITSIKATLDRIDVRLESLDNKIDRKFDSLDNKFDRKLEELNRIIASTSNKSDIKDDELGKRIDKLNERLWTNFIFVISGFVGIASLVGRAFHWF